MLDITTKEMATDQLLLSFHFAYEKLKFSEIKLLDTGILLVTD